ncbi:MAG: ATP phosphoribosyltransferase regulatory subunit [Cellvibrionales bacterium]|nr:ATP phosphoribosyltransferase regulatory subunit [Cellvibrionales bacterium]
MPENRWLLPPGIDELTGPAARRLELLRRRLLDLFDSWGYDLVVPPVVEYTDSLLTGLGAALDRQTFKFADRQGGKTLGLRADMSPQAARMDAHSLGFKGANRLCYCGTVVRVDTAAGSRAPVQIGAELFGIADIEADFEIIALLLATLEASSRRKIILEVAHQKVKHWLRHLATSAQLDRARLQQFIGDKRLPELADYLRTAEVDKATAARLNALPRLMGDAAILPEARRLYAQDPLLAEAINEMERLARHIAPRCPQVELFFNLSEMHRGAYHSGLVFAAYCEADGVALQVARGGRYDQVGSAFGRPRPATGFSADLRTLARGMDGVPAAAESVYAPLPAPAAEAGFWDKVAQLRTAGYRVKPGFRTEAQSSAEQGCQWRLVQGDSGWQLTDFATG